MAFEITCGQCSAQLLVESSGIVVECPLCGAHLSIPELAADGTVTNPTDLPADSTVLTATPASPPTVELIATSPEPVTSAIAAAPPDIPAVEQGFSFPAVEIAPASPIPNEAVLAVTEAATVNVAASAEDISSAEPSATATGDAWDQGRTSGPLTDEIPISPEEQQLSEEPTQVIGKQQLVDSMESAAGTTAEAATLDVAPVADSTTTAAWPAPGSSMESPVSASAAPAAMFTMGGAQPETSTPPPAPSTPSPSLVVATPDAAASDMVPRQRFIMVAGYASAITIAFLYLLMGALTQRAHTLESLPDLVPEIRKDGVVGMKRVLPQLDVAPGHELNLGQSQRFGNVVVTPVKVTRGPLTFQHAYGNANAKQPPSQPVLKLWLKFENVSRNQEFPPLDRTLVYRRLFDKKNGSVFSLNFLCEADQRKQENGERHAVYDMPEFSEFTLVGQDLDHWVKPGETWETYIPSEEGLAEIDGRWVWRVLFRKGLNKNSGRGVTTLIDVNFSDEDVHAES